MTLETGGPVDFKPRPVEGAPESAKDVKPKSLLLDGQQRMTSLYQVTIRGEVVKTVTARNKRVERWFYIDIEKALDPAMDREQAIIGVPANKIARSNFGKDIDLDLSEQAYEFEKLMYPVAKLFAWSEWQTGFINHYMGSEHFNARFALISRFHTEVLANFTSYGVPVISLDANTSKEAVCVVFEKVNTGGKPLDAFELITAMYAADGYELRKDWYGDAKTADKGRAERLGEYLSIGGAKKGILAGVGNTDFLHVTSLFHTRRRRQQAEAAGAKGNDLPQISGARGGLLNLPLGAYLEFQDRAEEGFKKAAKFLHSIRVYRVSDLPYQSQIIPLAAIFADLGPLSDNYSVRKKIEKWFWNGVFGELYGSATETRIARDFVEVVAWVKGGATPTTVNESTFSVDRLLTMRARQSAAYKGMNALLMLEGARDFLSGQAFNHTVFFDEDVDIHHVFPQKWCEGMNVDKGIMNSIVNKTPLSSRTNRIIGGHAPSVYLSNIERGNAQLEPVSKEDIDDALRSHLIDPILLRDNRFDDFIHARQSQLAALIERATEKTVFKGQYDNEENSEDVTSDEEQQESELTLSAAD